MEAKSNRMTYSETLDSVGLPAANRREEEAWKPGHDCSMCGQRCNCTRQENSCWHECPLCDCGHEADRHEPNGQHECGDCSCARYTPMAEELPKPIDWGVDPYAPMEAITHACGLLDVIKQEWGDQWTDHDQRVRSGLSKILVAPSAPTFEGAGQWTDEMARLLDLYVRGDDHGGVFRPTDVARVLVEKYRELPGNVGRDIFDSNPAYGDGELLALEGAGVKQELDETYLKRAEEFLIQAEKMDNAPVAYMVAAAFKNEDRATAALKDNAELKAMFELHKALITKCLCAGIRFEGDDEPLVNERAEAAEAELARLRGKS